MPLQIHQIAPDFTLPSTQGKDFTLRQDLANQPGIVYFYPKNFTKVCTQEACSFRDAFSVFRELDITVLGISQDSIQSHHKFKQEYELPFELLSDAEAKVAKAYKAVVPLVGMTRRVTYLIDRDHRIVAVYDNMFSAEKHIKKMIAKLNQPIG